MITFARIYKKTIVFIKYYLDTRLFLYFDGDSMIYFCVFLHIMTEM